LKLAACLAGAAWISWRLLLISLIFTPLALIVLTGLSRSLKRASRRALEEMSTIYAVLADSLRGIKIVKAFTMERFERRRADQAARRFYQKAMRVARYDALVRPSLETMGMIVVLVAVLAGAHLVLHQQTHLFGLRVTSRPLSISSMMLFFGFLTGTSDPARKLSGILSRLQRAAAAADRVSELFDGPAEELRSNRVRRLRPHRRLLHFQNVHFAYTPETPVLQGVNLKIAAGETVAIVGPNGSGKSTLASLVLRFYDPQEGAVRIDGLDLRQARLRDLRRQVGLVTQDPVLFNDTVEANIRVGRPEATRDEVVEAARRAQADTFIRQELPQGYQTVVGEGAGRLSGGQKQRIALARAILRDPRILVLDEATSQVDLESEQQIHEVLAEFMRDRTALIITHRLSILPLADRIVVMDQGRITDRGTYEELLARSALFRRLCQASSRHAA
jgi:ATP-binding cassette subfamily B protein/subfamily B ATP-binding cassette protein MsbA